MLMPEVRESPGKLIRLSCKRDILKLPEIGLDEPFLEAGGDSLTAMTLVMRVEQEFSIKVPLMAFFDAATIRLQAELIDRMIKESG